YPSQPVDSYRYFIGDGLRKAVERCLPVEARNEADISAFTQVQQADYQANWRNDAQPYDGIAELLVQLSRQGKRLAVLSNKPHAFALLCVDYFFPDIEFDLVLGHKLDVPLKPDPTGARQIARCLDLAASEIALIGDTWTDMSTAVAGGMLPIGALWGFRDYEELKNAGARHIIKHPSEVIAVIEGENS
ncbi:MAG: HAD family hydrolase, partial [Pseudomonadales bacterium]